MHAAELDLLEPLFVLCVWKFGGRESRKLLILKAKGMKFEHNRVLQIGVQLRNFSYIKASPLS